MDKLIVIYRLAAQIFLAPVDRLNGSFRSYLDATRSAGFRFTEDDTLGKGQVGPVSRAADVVEALQAKGFRVELDAAARELLTETAAAEVSPADRAAAIDAALAPRGLKPFGYQYEGIDYLADHDQALLHDDMGLGKTMQVCLALPEKARAVIVCPAAVKGVWATRELPTWRPDLEVTQLKGRGSFRWPNEGEVVVTNWDILTDGKKLEKAPEGVIVVADEAHYAKNNKAARTKRFRSLGIKARNQGGKVWLLTGTPLLNRPLDLWAVLQGASLGNAAFGSFDNFVRIFNGEQGTWGLEWYPMDDDQKAEAAECLAKVALGRRKGAVLADLPEKRHESLTIEAKNGALAALNSFQEIIEKRGFTVVDGVIYNPAGEVASLVDFTGDTLVFEKISRMRSLVASAKRAALMELVEEHEDADEPLIIFADHLEPLDELRTREGWGIIDGSTPNDERTRIVAAFQDGKLRGVAGTRAMAEGVTLTRASRMIFVERFWTPGVNAQAEDRIHRVGQKNACLYTTLVIDHVVDHMIANTLATKAEWVQVTDAAANDHAAPEAPKSRLAAVLDLPTYEPAPADEGDEEPAGEPEAPKYERLLALFEVAKDAGAKYPKFKLADLDGGQLRLEYINSGRNQGGVNVSTEGYGSTWYGRVEKTGHAHGKLEGAPAAVLGAIDAFMDSPERFARLFGKTCGACCFCGSQLDRLESYERGYGPVCADKYGLAFDHARWSKGEQAPHVEVCLAPGWWDAALEADEDPAAEPTGATGTEDAPEAPRPEPQADDNGQISLF